MKTTLNRIGQRVIYTLNEGDVRQIIQDRRNAGLGSARGNDPRDGQEYPAVIVVDWGVRPIPEYDQEQMGFEGQADMEAHLTMLASKASVNLQVFLDGNDSYWATSRSQFDPEKDALLAGGSGDHRGKWRYAQ